MKFIISLILFVNSPGDAINQKKKVVKSAEHSFNWTILSKFKKNSILQFSHLLAII